MSCMLVLEVDVRIVCVSDTHHLLAMQGGLWQKLNNSTIFGAAIVGLLSGAGCIHFLERTRGLTQGEWLQL